MSINPRYHQNHLDGLNLSLPNDFSLGFGDSGATVGISQLLGKLTDVPRSSFESGSVHGWRHIGGGGGEGAGDRLVRWCGSWKEFGAVAVAEWTAQGARDRV